MPEVLPGGFDGRHTTDPPAHAEVILLVFPPFGKNGAPEGVDEGISRGKVAQNQPGGKAKSSREDEEREVGLGEGKVEGNLERVSEKATSV